MEECPYCGTEVLADGWCTNCQTYVSDEAEQDDYLNDIMDRDD